MKTNYTVTISIPTIIVGYIVGIIFSVLIINNCLAEENLAEINSDGYFKSYAPTSLRIGCQNGNVKIPFDTGIATFENCEINEATKVLWQSIRGCFVREYGSFIVKWNNSEKYLEITGSNIHLKIYESGQIQKEEWKVLNYNSIIIPTPYKSFDNIIQ